MSQNEDSRKDIEQDNWLAKASVFFAVFFEVVPVEADAVFVSFVNGRFLFALVVKVTCLTLIFFPLAVYVVRNGLTALSHVRRSVAAVTIVVAVRLMLDFWMIWGNRPPPGG